ncbi:hypothetical protein FCIRC_2481 [Fusarium circinatum]|uniref:Azaphilone pigments biosynthesis cluster protein L N-terminal domain-containing protein n=1 Tax=Fusarium circinatum TaxID=48490 RepID=A0A8H5X9X1_FUSCI|nr:hypothetical protein FCIRC_2481 [Fusarium circinatum]
MEPVGATASILTFVTVAFSATKSIYGALSAIKDGPEILDSINDEISQLQNILQRLSQVVSSTTRPTDRSKVEQMVKKCRDDLVGFEVKLRQLDVSGADGRRGQLWRKLKICFEEKELDRMRHSTIQDQQSSLITTQSTEILARIQQLQQSSSTATQSTEILNRIEYLQQTSPSATQLNDVLVSLQQLQQSMATLQISSTSAQNKIGSSGISSRVVELDDEDSSISQQTALDDTIARLIRLLEKKPSIVEFDDAQEIFEDLERLLHSVRDDVRSTNVGDWDEDRDADVSKEIKLFTGLLFSAQSLRVNQTAYEAQSCDPSTKEAERNGHRRQCPYSHDNKTTEETSACITKHYREWTYEHRHDINFSEVLLCAGADPTVELEIGYAFILYKLMFSTDIETRKMLYCTFRVSPFLFSDSMNQSLNPIASLCNAWPKTSAEDLNPEQERQIVDLMISQGYSLNLDMGRQSGLHGFFVNKPKSFSRVLERRDLLTYLISRGADPCRADLWGKTPSDFVYGDIYISGYDISRFRCNYPRRARYKNGYSREIFEELWRGREERCPYWNNEPWPEFSNEEAESAFEATLGQSLCTQCWLCFDDDYRSCDRCGICLLVFQYSCTEKLNPDHEHDSHCPRSRVGYFERSENDGQYHFRPKSCSGLDSDDEVSDYDNTSSSSDEFEDEHLPPDQAVTIHQGYDSEEIISDNESVGGVSL